MREIKPTLIHELIEHCRGVPVWQAAAFEVKTYRQLVEMVARLAYANPDQLLFFRGQDRDYQSKAGATTLYPAIYRIGSLTSWELRHRFEILDQAARLLVDKFKTGKILGHRELRQKRYIQWSLLQHYEVIATPLLDLTQSLRVACSFAQIGSSNPTCFLYVLGLPYLTNRISINSEQDIVNIRLLSICPPLALRPYFQEGYLAGTADVTYEFDSKTDLDFRNRLVAKFAIPRARTFWGRGFNLIPPTALFPKGDQVLDLCKELRTLLSDELQTGELGEFVKEWAGIEGLLLENARKLTDKNVSVREAISALTKNSKFDAHEAAQLDMLRRFRNVVVHKPTDVKPTVLRERLDETRQHGKKLKAALTL
jgi:hypothetical protein